MILVYNIESQKLIRSYHKIKEINLILVVGIVYYTIYNTFEVIQIYFLSVNKTYHNLSGQAWNK